MATFQGKNIVITGGSDGIGKALVMQFLSLGAKVATCGRNAQKLEDLQKVCANDRLMIFTADVSKKIDKLEVENDKLKKLINEIEIKLSQLNSEIKK